MLDRCFVQLSSVSHHAHATDKMLFVIEQTFDLSLTAVVKMTWPLESNLVIISQQRLCMQMLNVSTAVCTDHSHLRYNSHFHGLIAFRVSRIDDAKCILVTRVCLCVCLSLAAFSRYCTDPIGGAL